MRKVLFVVVATLGLLFGTAATAFADTPGPGDKQCVPGQNSQPGPNQVGGTCPSANQGSH